MITAEELRARLGRPAAIGRVGGFRPPDDPRASWLGQVRVLGRGESWPDGLAGVCQVNVGELPFVPEDLADIALLSVFAGFDGEGWFTGDWQVRAYATLDELQPVEGVVAPDVRPFPVRWERLEADLPDWEDAARLVADDELDGSYYDIVGRAAEGLKVGGWPDLIQGETNLAGRFVLQVDTDEKAGLAWGDAGIVYVGRGPGADSWSLEWQCM